MEPSTNTPKQRKSPQSPLTPISVSTKKTSTTKSKSKTCGLATPPSMARATSTSTKKTTLELSPKHMTRFIKALHEGNPKLLTRMLLGWYEMTPSATSSALAALVRSSNNANYKGDAKILGEILKSMWDMDEEVTHKIVMDLFTEGPYVNLKVHA